MHLHSVKHKGSLKVALALFALSISATGLAATTNDLEINAKKGSLSPTEQQYVEQYRESLKSKRAQAQAAYEVSIFHVSPSCGAFGNTAELVNTSAEYAYNVQVRKETNIGGNSRYFTGTYYVEPNGVVTLGCSGQLSTGFNATQVLFTILNETRVDS